MKRLHTDLEDNRLLGCEEEWTRGQMWSNAYHAPGNRSHYTG